MGDTSAIFHILLLLLLLSYVRRGLCDPFFFFLRRALCGLDLYTVQSSCILHTKMDSVDKREKCLQRRRKRERSRRASETAEEREERLRKRRVRDRARRAAHSASAREIDLQQRRERSAAESPESREARLQRMRDRLVAETDEERGQATADERQVGSWDRRRERVVWRRPPLELRWGSGRSPIHKLCLAARFLQSNQVVERHWLTRRSRELISTLYFVLYASGRPMAEGLSLPLLLLLLTSSAILNRKTSSWRFCFLARRFCHTTNWI